MAGEANDPIDDAPDLADIVQEPTPLTDGAVPTGGQPTDGIGVTTVAGAVQAGTQPIDSSAT